MVKHWMFLPKIRNKIKMFILNTSTQHGKEVLARAIRQEREIISTQIGKKEVKPHSQMT